jgi:hypothetical protein
MSARLDDYAILGFEKSEVKKFIESFVDKSKDYETVLGHLTTFATDVKS